MNKNSDPSRYTSSHQAMCQAARMQLWARCISHCSLPSHYCSHSTSYRYTKTLFSSALPQFCEHSLRSLEHRFLPCSLALLIADKLAKVVFQSYAYVCVQAYALLPYSVPCLLNQSLSIHPSIHSFQHPSILLSIHPSTDLHILTSSLILFFSSLKIFI